MGSSAGSEGASPAKPEVGEGAPLPSNGSKSEEPTKLGKAYSHRSLLSISYGDLNNSGSWRGVPKQTEEASQQLKQFIAKLGGDRPIHSVLVANNGLAAVKFIRSVRAWAYTTLGSERAINIIAMATPEDMVAEAEHIRMADQFIEVPGGKNMNNYANVSLITSVAVRTGVDAVWPGWGHASEFPELPDALAATPTKIRFLGPPPGPMAALGDKIGSTILAQAASVPTLAWSGSGVSVRYEDCAGGEVPSDIYDRACIHSLNEALECCARIGYPVMLKASWGGGGKGIRKVLSDEDVRLVYQQVVGEVPGSPVFAMKLAPLSRHLEVQLLCDAHGQVASLFSRDCSVQRRHQKVVEEGPVTCASAETLQEMEKCARALARSVGYVGAATVEFLYLVDTGQYCFLELNPRLQVEHPVTEWISGVNLPAAQLLVGAGVPLHRIPDLRRLWGADVEGDSPLDFDNLAPRAAPSGHVVAVRLTAENANDGFKPTAGRLEELSFRSTPDVWGYFSIKGGGAVHEYSDSQFGHLFARGENRAAAIRAMVVALNEIRVRGEIRTTVDYVVDMIQGPEFLANAHHTAWLDARIAAQIRSGRPSWWLSVVCGAVTRALDRFSARSGEYLSYLQKGQLPPARISLVATSEEFVVDGVKYSVRVVRRAPQSFKLHLGGTTVDAVARVLHDGGVLLQVDGAAHVVHREEEALGTRLTIGSQTVLLGNEHDPSQLLSASTGKLVRHCVADAAHVAADEPYAEVEVMKMQMSLLAPASGTIRWHLSEGAVLVPGALIAKLDLDDPEAVRRAEAYCGGFPALGPPLPQVDGVGHRFTAALHASHSILAGYDDDPDKTVAALLACLDDPTFALVQWEEAYAAVRSRLPPPLSAALEAIVAEGLEDVEAAAQAEAQARFLERVSVGHLSAGGSGVLGPLMSLGSGLGGMGTMGSGILSSAWIAPPLASCAEDVEPGGHGSLRLDPGSAQGAPGAAGLGSNVPLPIDARGVSAGGSLIRSANLQPSDRSASNLTDRTVEPGTPLRARAALASLRVQRRFTPAQKCARQLSDSMAQALEAATPEDRPGLAALLEPLAAVARVHADGKDEFARGLCTRLLEDFLAVEEQFETGGRATEQEVIDALRLVHASSLQAVLDIVLAHQGLDSRATLVGRLMTALVLPAPDRYRPLLRRLAALSHSGSTAVSARAQRLLEQSLLGELRVVVARALLGLDLFSEASLRDLFLPDRPADESAQAGGAVAALARASGAPLTPPSRAPVPRRPTVVEGLYAGLGNLSSQGAGVEARMAMLVEAPAAVDDALASLLDHGDPLIQRRALLTYVRRIYHPFLLHEPALVLHGTGAPAAHRERSLALPSREGGPPGSQHASPQATGLGVAAVAAPAPRRRGHVLGALWAHRAPSWLAPLSLAGPPQAERHGGAVLVSSLADLPAALDELAAARAASGMALLARGTLHVVLTRDGESALALDAEAVSRLSEGVSGALAPDGGESRVEDVAAAASAALASLEPRLRAEGYVAVSVIFRRGAAAPIRIVFYAHLVDVGGRAISGEESSVPAAVGAPAESALSLRHASSSRLSVSLVLSQRVPHRVELGPWKYVLDPVLSLLEPPTAAVLELPRLAEARDVRHASSRNRQWHIYTVSEKREPRSPALVRAFLRGVVRQLGRPALLAATYGGDASAVATAALEEVAETLSGAVAELERLHAAGEGGTPLAAAPDWASVFLSVLCPLPLGGPEDEQRVAAALRGAAAAAAAAEGAALRRAALAQWEVRLLGAGAQDPAWRVVFSAPTGHEAGEECVEVYRESPARDGRPTYRLLLGAGVLDGTPVNAPYPPLERLQQRRLAARRHRTTYAYDFPAVFDNALRALWAERSAAGEPRAVPPVGRLVDAQELVLEPGRAGADPSVAPRRRAPSANDVGVVAWVLSLCTPECPSGRRVVVVANDITFSSGSFGPREDAFFKAATEWALAERLPLVYIAANSGARVGLAEEVKRCLRAEWIAPEDPTKGFRYLYLSAEDHAALCAEVVDAEEEQRADEAEKKDGWPSSAAPNGGAPLARRKGPRTVALRAEPCPASPLQSSDLAPPHPPASRAAKKPLAAVVHAERLVDVATGEVRFVLKDVIGREDGLGVECLSGSGAIAGAFSRAFREGFTVTLVSGRTVGIGAYLARLGRRCIQRAEQPIILTGYAALNKLLGREVYTSQQQLGGPRVMAANGISHHVVEDDLAGVTAVLRWVGFTPAQVGGPLLRLPTSDPVSRAVEYCPAEGDRLEARAAIAGQAAVGAAGWQGSGGAGGSAAWQGGLFDRGTWVECQAGWARTVVTGRARLGGVPVGVVAVETSTVMLNLPADPGMPDSAERTIPQAGQVWFPDSALKTAQAVEEFGREGLPLFVLANWRGFSGGQRDLFEGVLQAGACIVEAIRTYRQPVVVYLGPGCELRGGAWVVVDAQINPGMVEMFADPSARGAVLEPEGVVEIKFRPPDLLALARRLDPELARLVAQQAQGGPAAEAAVRARERALLPVYTQLAVAFARMHDGPVRMLAKGVLHGIVPWARARAFFAAHLRRRLAEEELLRHIASADPGLGRAASREALKNWFLSSPLPAAPTVGSPQRGSGVVLPPASRRGEELWRNDGQFLEWVEGGSGAARVAMELKALRLQASARTVHQLCRTPEGTEGLVRGLAQCLAANPSLQLQLRSLLK